MPRLTPRIVTGLTGLMIVVPAMAQTPPAPIQALEQRGLDRVSEFDAPAGLKGYVMSMQGRELTVFLTDDEEYAIVGTLLDGEGRDLSEAPLSNAAAQRYEGAWDRLEDSHWVVDGDVDAERVVYTFTDANCPFCHRFWEASQPWVEAGQVQVRHIIVALLRPDSMPKGASILAADAPSQALARHNERYARGGIAPAQNPAPEIAAQINANNAVMRGLGLGGTPATFYLDEQGRAQVRQGLPDAAAMQSIMGGAAP